MKQKQYPCIQINAPDWYKDPEFRNWFIKRCCQGELATWHGRSEQPHEYSDLFLTYDHGEGSDSDMPERFWSRLCELLGDQFAVVWLTNVGEN